MTQADQVTEMKQLVAAINEKMGFEGIGFRIDGHGSFDRVDMGLSMLRGIAVTVGVTESDENNEYAPDYSAKSSAELPVHITAEGEQILRMKEELRWFVNTLEWLANPENRGGITTCGSHNGHGFASDCAICSKVRAVKAALQA